MNTLYQLFLSRINTVNNLLEIIVKLWFSQILNLCQALEDKKSPLQLVQMPLLRIERRGDGKSNRGSNFIQRFQDKYPFFTAC